MPGAASVCISPQHYRQADHRHSSAKGWNQCRASARVGPAMERVRIEMCLDLGKSTWLVSGTIAT